MNDLQSNSASFSSTSCCFSSGITLKIVFSLRLPGCVVVFIQEKENWQCFSRYPASRGYIFAVWAGVQKVASADNRSIFYRACTKFVTRFASNWFVKSAWVSRENYLRTTLLLELLFWFSASPPLVLSILAAKFPRIVFFRKVFLSYQL